MYHFNKDEYKKNNGKYIEIGIIKIIMMKHIHFYKPKKKLNLKTKMEKYL